MWQVNVRGGDPDLSAPVLDLHDPVEGVVITLCYGHIVGEIDEFFFVRRNEGTPQDDFASRVMVRDPVTCLAQLLVSGGWDWLLPGPAAMAINGAAFRAHARLDVLDPKPVWIMDPLADQAVTTGRRRR
jgi:hypothetical protein